MIKKVSNAEWNNSYHSGRQREIHKLHEDSRLHIQDIHFVCKVVLWFLHCLFFNFVGILGVTLKLAL